jgi:hypothetical protein
MLVFLLLYLALALLVRTASRTLRPPGGLAGGSIG